MRLDTFTVMASVLIACFCGNGCDSEGDGTPSDKTREAAEDKDDTKPLDAGKKGSRGVDGGTATARDGSSNVGTTSKAGVHRVGDELIVRTGKFTVPPNDEKYLCWTLSMADAMKVKSYRTSAHAVIQQVVFVTTEKGEPDGFSDCDAPFQLAWRPLFSAGAGNASLKLPAGVAQPVKENARLLMQLHLVNATSSPITDSADLTMTLSDEEDTEDLQYAVMGNSEISLPPDQSSEVVTNCKTQGAARVIGFFPQMHQLGTSMKLELGATPEAMRVVYERDPYDFNDQRIDQMDFQVDSGLSSRLTCSYKNTQSSIVKFGESTLDELCYLMMLVVGSPGIGCTIGPNNPIASTPIDSNVAERKDGGTAMPMAGPNTPCPSVTGQGITLNGCCTEGMCGIDTSDFGFGCQELGVASAGAMGMGIAIEFPSPRACPSSTAKMRNDGR